MRLSGDIRDMGEADAAIVHASIGRKKCFMMVVINENRLYLKNLSAKLIKIS